MIFHSLFKRILGSILVCFIGLAMISNEGLAYQPIEAPAASSFAKANAITAQLNGLLSIPRNPAGLSGLEDPSVYTFYESRFDHRLQAFSFGIGHNLNGLKIGLFLPVQWVPDIPETVDNGGQASLTGSFQDLQIAANLAVATAFAGDWHVGLNTKIITHKIANQTGSGVGFDAGLALRLIHFNLGLSILDVGRTTIKWPDSKDETIRERLNFGIQVPLPTNTLITLDVSQQLSPTYSTGLIQSLSENFDLLAGLYDLGSSNQLRLGLSMDLMSFLFNVAISQHDKLGATYQVSLMMNP
jgi:hypothetical protein